MIDLPLLLGGLLVFAVVLSGAAIGFVIVGRSAAAVLSMLASTVLFTLTFAVAHVAGVLT